MKTLFQKKNAKRDRREAVLIIMLSIATVVGPVIAGIIYVMTK